MANTTSGTATFEKGFSISDIVEESYERLGIQGVSDYVRVSELKKQAVQKLIDTVDHSQVLDYL